MSTGVALYQRRAARVVQSNAVIEDLASTAAARYQGADPLGHENLFETVGVVARVGGDIPSGLERSVLNDRHLYFVIPPRFESQVNIFPDPFGCEEVPRNPVSDADIDNFTPSESR